MRCPADWPNADHSHYVEAGGVHWHVQVFGRGPCLLFLHGTGASGHSFADIAHALAHEYTVVVPDLPGQGFSSLLPATQTNLAGFGDALLALIQALGVTPSHIIGHSAGAALGAHLQLSGRLPVHALISINGAFLPFGAAAAPVFSRAAEVLARSRLLAWITAAHGLFERPIRRLLEETGSEPTEAMIHCYQTLLRNPDHVTGTLRMMAGWRLDDLKRQLPALTIPLHLLVCDNDKTVAPWQAERLAELVFHARITHLPGFGHLGHEQAPETFVKLIRERLSRDTHPHARTMTH